MIDIQLAIADEAEALAQCHFASVRALGQTFYEKEVLAEWAPALTADRIEQFRLAILGEAEITLVAKRDENIVGFGSITPFRNELTAVYVCPTASRKGYGKALASYLEQRAREQGLQYLQLDASFNAIKFYRHCGYLKVADSSHQLRSGIEMPCAIMRKHLN